MTPDVAVIIPTFNRRSCLERALDSVLAQSLPPTEILVVDDGSDDGSDRLLADRYPGVNYLYQDNRGVSAARNAGIAASDSEWLALLDSDDEWLPSKLERQFAALEKQPAARLIHCDEIWIRNGVRVNQGKRHRKHGGHIFRRCLPQCAISPSAAVLHRSLLDEVGGFDETLPACEDYDLWLRICARHGVLYVDEPLLNKYGGHADQLSRRHWGMDRFRIQALDKLLCAGALSPGQAAAARRTLLEKIRIVLNGAQRRDRHEAVARYRALLDKYQALELVP